MVGVAVAAETMTDCVPAVLLLKAHITMTVYVPGGSDGKRYAPALSVTPVWVPETSTGLLIVTLTPGMTPPCSLTLRTRMLPVCTCANANVLIVRVSTAANVALNHPRDITHPPQKLDSRLPGWCV